MNSDKGRAQEELHRDAELFRFIVESATEYAILACDREGRFVAWNAGAERILGYSEAEALGRDASIIFTPEDNSRGRPQEELREAIDSGRAQDRRWHERKDGSRFWADGLTMPLRDEAGGLRGFVKILRDCTAERLRDEALEESETIPRAIAANLPNGAVFLVDRELRYRMADGEALREAGFTPSDFEGKTLREALPPELTPHYERHYRGIFAGEGFVSEHESHGRAYTSHGLPLKDAGGSIYAALVVSYNITERKRAEETLKASAERLKFLDALGEATRSLVDPEAIMAETARLLGEHLGTSRCAYADVEADGDSFIIRHDWCDGVPSAVGVYLLDLFGPRAAADMRAGRPLVINDVDEELLPGEGADMFNSIGIKAIVCCPLVKEGRLAAMMAVHDAAPRRWPPREVALVEETVERSWAHIERARALWELRENDRRKDEFLAMLAHELRNPLAGIAGAIRLARRGGMEREIPFAHEVIERQSTNLARLIEDLLDVSRITQGKVELKREVLDLPAVIHRAVEAVRPLIEQRRHELTIRLAAGPMHVDADPTRLEQVFGNLLTNSAKYSEEGGQITVSARVQGSLVVVSVKDTGVGISPEMLPRVFDLFTQADRSLARSEGGLGIGLSLVKKLVELHGGTISAASELGEGSEFTVRLPVAEKALEAARPAAGRDGAGRDGAGRGRRLLIVDDNADTARLTGRLLRSMGFAVQIVHDGRAAIEAARLLQPEIVLLDIGLPGMDGFEVARQLRGDECCRGSLIIGVSGYGDDESREEGREAGFDHHLVKPVDLDSLLTLIDSRTGG